MTTLRALGFCGIDDSIDPNLLSIISTSYPFVEWGVLFRPDKEGQPRYATKTYVETLASVQSINPNMKLAAHLCGEHVHEILSGDDTFLSKLVQQGFKRVQINATAVNGVNISNLKDCVTYFLGVVTRNPTIEFIIQKNEETRFLWKGLLSLKNEIYDNISMLVDESKGTGVLSTAWPKPKDYKIGYAGGIGPDNISTVLDEIVEVANGHDIWIDMESSLRSVKDGKDIFDLNKCYECIKVVCKKGLHSHPSFLC